MLEVGEASEVSQVEKSAMASEISHEKSVGVASEVSHAHQRVPPLTDHTEPLNTIG